MRNELKIGIFVGVVVVGVILFVVNRTENGNGQNYPADMNRDSTLPQEDTTRNLPDVTKPVPANPPAPVVVDKEDAKAQSPAKPSEEIIPAVHEERRAPVIVVPEPEVKKPRYHIVKQGESLYKISEQYYGRGNQSKGVRVIQEANSDRVKRPGIIYPGWRLRIPYPEEISP